jgi:hypothetical protein
VTEMIEPMTAQFDQQQFGRELVGKARAVGGVGRAGCAAHRADEVGAQHDRWSQGEPVSAVLP